jgi:hypothetical protein
MYMMGGDCPVAPWGLLVFQTLSLPLPGAPVTIAIEEIEKELVAYLVRAPSKFLSELLLALFYISSTIYWVGSPYLS